LETLFGEASRELSAQLAMSPDWSSRFALVEHFLGQRLAATRREINPEIRWAWGQLRRSGGQVPIAALAGEIGWSGRYFGRRFWEETGIRPKAAARRLRFDRARRIVQETSVPLVDAALASGYSDQSHMTREFAELAGCAPAALRATCFPDLLGTPSSAVHR
jgi:transcriptional regulator GlxA family with amidase domain